MQMGLYSMYTYETSKYNENNFQQKTLSGFVINP